MIQASEIEPKWFRIFFINNGGFYFYERGGKGATIMWATVFFFLFCQVVSQKKGPKLFRWWSVGIESPLKIWHTDWVTLSSIEKIVRNISKQIGECYANLIFFLFLFCQVFLQKNQLKIQRKGIKPPLNKKI